MKYILAVVCVGLLTVALIATYKANRSEEVVCGGWSQIDELVEDHTLEVFNKAISKEVGLTYEPLKLIGTQVVAGMNYKFLCNVTKDGVKQQMIIVVYEDLEGNCTITSRINY